MTLELIRHPDHICAITNGIGVDLEWQAPGLLWLRYHAELDTDRLALPGPAKPLRQDELWRTTCFELFLRAQGAADYLEFNFSPSSAWAAYAFERLRAGRVDLEMVEIPQIFLDGSRSHIAIETTVRLSGQFANTPLELGLSAIIEARDGMKSYWALAHPPGAPDFHAPDCFALDLPPQGGA